MSLKAIVCRVLPHLRADGPTNMAIDEALLDSVAGDPSMAVIRTYEWSTPTLSLGYFQKQSEVRSDPRWSSAPIVRRPTGGGALWHDLEVTYAVVIPGQHPLARPSRALYQAVHEAIANHLQDQGIPATRRGATVAELLPEASPRPFLCFTDRDEEDVVFRNAKIVGSAQRRRSGAILQHGSLLLSRSSTTPELPGLRDLAPVIDSTENWATTVRELLARTLKTSVITDLLHLDEEQRIEGLRASVYASPAWTFRR